jgi:predicted transposase YbfD/YdcC
LERRSVSLWQTLDALPQTAEWAGLKSIIRVTSYRHRLTDGYILIRQPSTRYYISSVDESVEAFGQRIRNYWHVEKRCDPASLCGARERAPRHKVHYVRDVTQKEDASRIRVHPLPNILAVARNFTLNLFREQGLENMAQAQRRAGFGLDFLKSLFRMK